MGIVYRARSVEDGHEVAVKTVRTRAPRLVTALRAEVYALSGVEHVGIVRIVREGLRDSQPWYAMELLSGASLDQYNRSLFPKAQRTSVSEVATVEVSSSSNAANDGPWRRRNSNERHAAAGGRVQEVIRIYAALAAALAHLHRHGILHRDVKPGNVMLGSGLSPKLLDFGLASRLEQRGDAAWVNEPGRVAGTLPYLSPELISGRIVDSRSDLYALGCMLYESVAGVAPFAESTAAAVFNAHLNDAPIPPSQVVADVPSELENLILALLAKEPRERVAYAEDVSVRLESLLVERRRTPAAAPQRVHLLRPALFGRAAALTELRSRARLSGAGSRRVTIVRGEGGIGKTFLVSEFARGAKSAGSLVLRGGAPPPAAPGSETANAQSAPLGSLQSMLQVFAERARICGVAGAAPLSGDDFRLLARYEPLLAATPGFDELSEPATSVDDLVDNRVLDALARVLSFLSSSQPVLLVLEDLHWADLLTRRFVGTCVEVASEKQIFVLGTWRTETSVGAAEPWLEAGIDWLVLPPLDDSSIEILAADMLGVRALPQFLLQNVLQHSAGNPFLAGEYVRAALDSGHLSRVDGRWSFEHEGADRPWPALPSFGGVEELLRSRLAELSEGARGVLELAAVLGHELELDLLEQLEPELDVAAAVAELRRHSVLDSSPNGTLHFLHHRLREQAYLDIPAQRRAALHRRTARQLELATLWSDRRQTLLPQIALHWAAAGERVSAARAFRTAAESARARGASADAARYFDDAIEQLCASADTGAASTRAELAELYEASGDLLLLLGEVKRCERALQDAERTTSSVLAQARLRRKQAAACNTRQATDSALGLLESAEELLALASPSHDTRAEWLEIRIERAWTLYWPGRTEELSRLIAETEPTVVAHGSPIQRMRMAHCSIMSDLRRTRYAIEPRTLRKARKAVADAEASPSIVEKLSAQFTLGFVLLLGQRPDEALGILEIVLRSAEGLSHQTRALRAQAYISLAHRLRGDVEAARVVSLGLLARATALTAVQYRALGLANFGWVALQLGDDALAEEQLSSALDLWRAARPLYPLMGFAAWPLLGLMRRKRDGERARELARVLLAPEQRGLAEDLHSALIAVSEPTSEAQLFSSLDEALRLADGNGYGPANY